ncbi:MAG: hypothetical protein H7326_04695 [Bdellovibrionaceae bacterium]|nr:hypothetical protein [Pseudobdellovibrionaceae bacterium]
MVKAVLISLLFICTLFAGGASFASEYKEEPDLCVKNEDCKSVGEGLICRQARYACSPACTAVHKICMPDYAASQSPQPVPVEDPQWYACKVDSDCRLIDTFCGRNRGLNKKSLLKYYKWFKRSKARCESDQAAAELATKVSCVNVVCKTDLE